LIRNAISSVGNTKKFMPTCRIPGGRHETDQPPIQGLSALAQLAKGEKAMPYPKFLQRFTVSMVRDVAATGRMI
jgi:hypothetical protein